MRHRAFNNTMTINDLGSEEDDDPSQENNEFEASDSSNSELRDLSGCISADPANQSGFTARLDKLEQANLIMSRQKKFKRAGDRSKRSL